MLCDEALCMSVRPLQIVSGNKRMDLEESICAHVYKSAEQGHLSANVLRLYFQGQRFESTNLGCSYVNVS